MSLEIHYEVIVGNIGSVYSGFDAEYAENTYALYCKASEDVSSMRAAGEDVTLRQNGDILKEFSGRISREDGESEKAYVVHLDLQDGHTSRISRHLVTGCISEAEAVQAAVNLESASGPLTPNEDGHYEDVDGTWFYKLKHVTPVPDSELEIVKKYF